MRIFHIVGAMKKPTKKKKQGRKAPAKAAKTTSVVHKNKAGVSPMGDRVLVKPTPQDTVTSFGIIIPDTAKEKPEQGVVVAVGAGKRSDSGALIPVALRVGDKVLFSKYGYDEVKVDGVEYYLVREDNILAVFN